MPEPFVLFQVMALSAAVAAAVQLAFGWPWRSPRPILAAWGGILGMGAAVYLGCILVDTKPAWPPVEDRHRFLTLLVPAVLLVELWGSLPGLRWWLAWPPRLVVALAAARVLLHATSYLADLEGPDTARWSPAEAWMILLLLGGLLAAEWVLLAFLARRSPGPALPLALALTCAGTAAAVMYSGNIVGGQIGVPLAGAFAGAAVAAAVLPATRQPPPALGIGLVGLFSVLVMGRYFGDLSTAHALLLGLAPLLCWLPEVVPGVRKSRAPLRAVLPIALVALPVALAVAQARNAANAEGQPASSPSEESIQDYENFGH